MSDICMKRELKIRYPEANWLIRIRMCIRDPVFRVVVIVVEIRL